MAPHAAGASTLRSFAKAAAAQESITFDRQEIGPFPWRGQPEYRGRSRPLVIGEKRGERCVATSYERATFRMWNYCRTARMSGDPRRSLSFDLRRESSFGQAMTGTLVQLPRRRALSQMGRVASLSQIGHASKKPGRRTTLRGDVSVRSRTAAGIRLPAHRRSRSPSVRDPRGR